MGNKSKAIGNGFERECARMLTEFFGMPFQRTPNSGAFCGGRNASRISGMSGSQALLARGDLIVPDEMSHVMFECKRRKDVKYNQLLCEGGCRELDEWLDQVLVDYLACDDVSLFLLLFRSARQGKSACFMRCSGLVPPMNHCSYGYHGAEMVVTEFSERFLSVNRDAILRRDSIAEDRKRAMDVLSGLKTGPGRGRLSETEQTTP